MNEEQTRPDPRELFTINLPLIRRAIAFTCRRHRFNPDDAEDFASVVTLRLVENDYAVLRKYKQRCSFFTFIVVVIQRMALDYRIHQWGKWHASAEAKRLGEVAVDLERHLRRDQRTFDEAASLIRQKHGDVPHEALERIAARLPERGPRRRAVDTDVLDDAAAPDTADDRALTAERGAASRRVSAAMARLLSEVAPDDRLILQLRFEHGMTVAQIARARGIDQKVLYRRIERCLCALRGELERIGVTAEEVSELVGRPDIAFEFILRNHEARPSTFKDGEVSSGSEVSQ